MPLSSVEVRAPTFGLPSRESSTVTVSLPVPPSIVSAAPIAFADPAGFEKVSGFEGPGGFEGVCGQKPAQLPTPAVSLPAPSEIVVAPEMLWTATVSLPSPVEIVVEPVCVEATVTWSEPAPRSRTTAPSPR